MHTLRTPTTSTIADSSPTDERQLRRITKLIRRRTFCTLATSSDADAPHVAGVVYQWVDGALWVHVMRTSRKARNIAANPRVAVAIPFRRLPAGPPYTIHFQGRAELVDMRHADAQRLLDAGALGKISGHGALDEPDGVFVRIRPRGTVHSFGPGASVIGLIRDPLHAGARSVRLAPDRNTTGPA